MLHLLCATLLATVPAPLHAGPESSAVAAAPAPIDAPLDPSIDEATDPPAVTDAAGDEVPAAATLVVVGSVLLLVGFSSRRLRRLLAVR